jgi:Domain of unknown function (DUF6915)
MDLFEHEKESMKELGQTWTEVHVFLDQYSQKYRGFLHRRLLHHQLGVEQVEKRFGEGARQAALLHIKQDMGFVPKTWKELDEYSFFLGNEELEQEKDLKELYGEKLFTDIENGSDEEP